MGLADSTKTVIFVTLHGITSEDGIFFIFYKIFEMFVYVFESMVQDYLLLF
jgi:hypothetical protein